MNKQPACLPAIVLSAYCLFLSVNLPEIVAHAAPSKSPGSLQWARQPISNGPQPGTQSGPQPGTQPGPQSGPQPGTQPGTQPGPQPGTQPGPQTGAQPGTQSVMKRGTREGM